MTAGPRKPSRWRRFVSDESGSISIEAVLWIPVLLAAWLLMVSAAAAYHAVIGNVNGAHAVGDVVSRQTQVLDAADLDDLNALHRLISQSGTGTDVRITTLRFDAADNSFALLGSLAAENAPALSQAEVDALANTLPAVPDGDQLILVETWLDHAPLSALLAETFSFHHMATVRPRLAAQIRLVD